MRRLLFLFLVLAPACLQAAPQRVVSLNLCTDLLALQLLPRERIQGVTELAADPVYSPLAAQARGIAVTGQDLEAILGRRPDLVLAASFSDPYVLGRLRELGIPVVQLVIPTDIDGTRAFIMAVADALGEPARGEQLQAGLQERWQALGEQARRTGPRRVLLYRPGGVTMGQDSLEDLVIRQAGLVNVADEMGLQAWSALSLEEVLLQHPDRVLLDDDGPGSASLAEGVASHPALARAGIAVRRIPHRDWICPGPALADAVALLMETVP